MKRTELASYNDKVEIEKVIARKFAEWDTIYAQGQEGLNFISDGLLLNSLRNDIKQLRQKCERLFGTDLAGQLSMYGGEVKPERRLPDILPANWNAPCTLEYRRSRIETYFCDTNS